LSPFPPQRIAHFSPIITDQNNAPYWSISPAWDIRPPVNKEAAHGSKLEENASRVNRLDDCTPSNYHSVPMKDQLAVDKLVGQREAEARNARLHKLLKAVGL
jgi:hypothetical protein